MIHIIRTSADDTAFQTLVTLLDQDLKIRDGAEHSFYAQFNSTGNIRNVVVAYSDDRPVGCGAFKPYNETTVEIKRMFVHPDFRGKGIAMQVLSTLESWAAELKYVACVLETGKNQPEAIRLYQKAGYATIPNYGQYEHVENSVCMRKRLDI